MSKLYMMIGLPASGKSTILKEIAEEEDAEIVSSDLIREELYGSEEVQGDNNKVFKLVYSRLIEGLKSGKNMIFDATNINYKKRRAFLQRLNKLNVEKVAVLVATSYEECLRRNSIRERKVPEEVITRMYHNFYIPQYYEGFDKIVIKYNDEYNFSLPELEDMNQDNPHHTLTVKEHCVKAERYLEEKFSSLEKNALKLATLLHDIGKLKTKTFINARGEETEIAHFYNHEKVSAYDAMFNIGTRMIFKAGDTKGVLYILNLIQWHMLLHFEMSEKTITKYKNMLGEETWNDLEILHEADCEAR